MIYLDDETEKTMRKAAETAGLPYSRWVAGLIQRAANSVWPTEFLNLAGSIPDAPLSAEIRAADAQDIPRVRW
jgi:hypothetical protein